MDWTQKETQDGAMWLLLFLLTNVWWIIDPPKWWTRRKLDKENHSHD